MTQPPIDPTKLPYRQGVGLCLFNSKGQVLMAERRDRPNSWQMPQGGVNKGEITHVAALRELKEEVGTDNARIIARMEGKTRYEFPDWLQWRGGVFRGKYRGQEQEWFALMFMGQDSDIDLSGEHEPENPEFVNWKWAALQDTPTMIVEFKREVYNQMVAAFTPLAEAIARGEPMKDWTP